MSRTRVAVLAAVSSLVAACADSHSPLGPPASEAKLAPALTVGDASGPVGLEGFHFRPPIGATPPTVENLDASLLDLLSIEICAWDGSECVLPLVREMTAELRAPERLKVSDDAIYGSVWNTRSDDLDPNQTYRIRVLASGGELAYVDVDVLDPDDRNEGDTDHVHIVPGQTLPIRFVIEVGTGERAGADGGVVELAGGQVVLDVPEGALTGDAFLTAAPTDDVPSGGPPIVPGTAWAFGPDGIEFEHPVFMTIAYNRADLPDGVDENVLRIHKLVDGEFVQQNAGLVDLINHTVSAEVDGFSVFVVIPRDPDNPEDIEAPEVRSMQVFDPATGTFGDAVTIDVSGADQVVSVRLAMTDDISGVLALVVQFVGPSGEQLRNGCDLALLDEQPPNAGSDTNGEWLCPTTWPPYSEAGTWSVRFVRVTDKTGNRRVYTASESGALCDLRDVLADCIAPSTEVTVVSVPTDLTAPTIQSFAVSLDTQPRVFGPSVTVNASTGPTTLIFGWAATDDLSGVGVDPSEQRFPGFFFGLVLIGPSGQGSGWFCWDTPASGTRLDGFWECDPPIRQFAEEGTWRVTQLRVTDRVGNGGGFQNSYRENGMGELCNGAGACVSQPTVEVIGAGDSEPPALVGLGIALDGSDVVTTMPFTDNISGVSRVSVSYSSTETTQFQLCEASLTGGTPQGGVWACTISFPQFAALGQWVVRIFARDAAENTRSYFRRASDGFLCYNDPDIGQVCQDFGDTDIILQ